MKCQKSNLVALAAAFLVFAICPPLAARTFTDQKGRKLKATIVAFAPEAQIVIKSNDQEFTVPVTTFSLEDQAYIKKWIEENPTAKRIEVNFNYFVDLERADTDMKKTESLQAHMQTQNWIYDFSVTNASDTDLDNLRIVYQILIADIVDAKGNYNKMAYTNEKAEQKLQRIRDEAKVDLLPSKKRADIKKQFGVEKYVDRDGRNVAVSAQDKILGIWIRVYSGDQLLDDYKRAETGESLREVAWDENDKSDGSKATVR